MYSCHRRARDQARERQKMTRKRPPKRQRSMSSATKKTRKTTTNNSSSLIIPLYYQCSARMAYKQPYFLYIFLWPVCGWLCLCVCLFMLCTEEVRNKTKKQKTVVLCNQSFSRPLRLFNTMNHIYMNHAVAMLWNKLLRFEGRLLMA